MGTSGLVVVAFDISFVLPWLYLSGALMLAALVVAFFRAWRRRCSPPATVPSDQLAHFRRLYERGEISKEEFERLRRLLGGQMRQALEVPAQQAPPPAPGANPAGPGEHNGEGAGPGEAGIRPA
jgi:hypothetical protein